MTIIINPGSGPVEGATEEWAAFNAGVFTGELIQAGLTVVWAERRTDLDHNGRAGWAVLLEGDDEPTLIEMPGISFDRVRYIEHPSQNIWDFPRLYIDGSSWVWKFAVEIIVQRARERAAT